jgi:hypothetical protein
MSLHNLAHQVQSAGRGDDKVLVHMTPGEVKGLQSIAMAHGGSLTINPQTGLPEAGFLSSILPMVAGLGLSMIPGVGPMMAASIVGGGTAIATGDLKKGLMAGLGAYGGAGLGSGLMAQGATGAANAGVSSIDEIALANSKAAANSQIGNVYGGANAATNAAATAPYNWAGGPQLATNAAAAPGMTGYGNAIVNSAPVVPNVGGQTVTAGVNQPVASFGVKYQPPPITEPVRTVQDFAGKATYQGGYPTSGTISRPFTDAMSQLGRGAEKSFTSMEGLKGLYDTMPTGSVVASGLTLADAMKPEYEKPKETKSMIRPYEFSYNSTNVSAEPYSGSAERTYFNPVFTAKDPYEAPGPEYAAEGGLMGLAVGGITNSSRAALMQEQQALAGKDPVQQMSELNAVGGSTGFPMSNIKTPSYNVSKATPIPTNMLESMGDTGVDPYSGAEQFARGGATAAPETTGGYTYSYNPSTQQFTQTGGPGAMPSGKDLALGIGAQDMLHRFTEMQATGNPYNFTPSWAKSTATPNGPVSGGLAQPAMQPAAPAQPFIPNIDIPAYQTPEQQLGLGSFYNMMDQQLAGYGGYAAGGNVGGISHLGDYSDGGRLLKGPGDGVSDSIPASIGNRQPARLADGEFVVPARIVSEIGNGSTEAGARKLYAMMDRVQKARRKTVGKKQVAVNSKADKYLPA